MPGPRRAAALAVLVAIVSFFSSRGGLAPKRSMRDSNLERCELTVSLFLPELSGAPTSVHCPLQ